MKLKDADSANEELRGRVQDLSGKNAKICEGQNLASIWLCFQVCSFFAAVWCGIWCGVMRSGMVYGVAWCGVVVRVE